MAPEEYKQLQEILYAPMYITLEELTRYYGDDLLDYREYEEEDYGS